MTSRRPWVQVIGLTGCISLAACFGEANLGGTLSDRPSRPAVDDSTVPPKGGDGAVPTGRGCGPYRWQRLTAEQYDNTVRYLLGETRGLASAARREGIGDSGLAEAVIVDGPVLEHLGQLAAAVAEGARPRLTPDGLLGCDPTAMGEAACAQDFISRMGRKLFRRPLTAEETTDFGDLYALSRSTLGRDFEGGLILVLEAFLQSPEFLYVGGGTPGQAANANGCADLDPWALASRLALFLWSSAPDEALLTAAAEGRLETDADIEREVRRMLGDPRARAAVSALHRQWLKIRDLTDVADPAAADATPLTMDVRRAALAETDAFVQSVVFDGDGRLQTLLTDPTSFVDPALAGLYGVTEPVNGVERRSVPHRWGLLTQAAVLASHSAPMPILRGKLIREALLCHELHPPANVADLKLPERTPGMTLRQQHQLLVDAPGCGSCHRMMDPIGFGFLAYDVFGRHQPTDEAGSPIDASGTVFAVDGTDRAFTGTLQLFEALAESPQVKRCVAKTWLRYGLRRADVPDDAPALHEIQTAFEASGHDMRALILAVTRSSSFRQQAASAEGSP